MSYLCSWNDPKRPISSDASLSGACGASSRRRRWWRWCLAEATRGRGRIGCCRVSARPGKPRRSWCGRGGGRWAAGLEGGGTGTRAGRTPKRRARASADQRVMPGARGPAPGPMAARPALSDGSRAAGSAGHDSADGDQAGTWRRGASLLPPQAPPPPSMRSPQAQPRRGRGGRGGAALPPWPPGPCASSDGRRRPRHPQDGRTWVGAGTLRRAAAAAARGGREWGAVAGARLMTSQPGCGSAGARTWLRRRRPRAALGPERPAPSCGAARRSAPSESAPARGLEAPRRLGPPPGQPPLA